MVTGPKMVTYAHSDNYASAGKAPSSVYEREQKRLEGVYDAIAKKEGDENPYQIWWELGQLMNTYVTVERHNKELQMVDETIQKMMERWQKCSVLDTGKHANQALMFTRQLWNMLLLARVVTIGALKRDESRGSHFKPEFPQRDDEKFLKSTIATYDAGSNHGPKITYEDVDISLVKPVLRDYTGKGAAASTPPRQPAARTEPRA
jgi:succinate dehydrogenase / fumarate reductase flavoprotein subunit